MLSRLRLSARSSAAGRLGLRASRQPAGRPLGARQCSNSSGGGSAAAEAASTGSGSNPAIVTAPTSSQLLTLACASGLPFVGFGFADNFIMILVGDQIDCTLGACAHTTREGPCCCCCPLRTRIDGTIRPFVPFLAGVRFGLSTMAAAGFGNLISDVVGISLGEMIEAAVAKVLSAPPLSYEQLQLRKTRLVKGSANAIGISIGCLLGMAPLYFMHDRKVSATGVESLPCALATSAAAAAAHATLHPTLCQAVFFDDDELDVYHTSFAPYGVSPQQFFELLHHGKWRTVEEGTTLVQQGDVLNTTMFLHAGEWGALDRAACASCICCICCYICCYIYCCICCLCSRRSASNCCSNCSASNCCSNCSASNCCSNCSASNCCSRHSILPADALPPLAFRH